MSYIEVRDSRTGYLLPVRDAQGTLPDVESCWDAIATARLPPPTGHPKYKYRYPKYKFRHRKYKFRHPKYKFRHPKYKFRHPKYKFRHPKYKFRHPKYEFKI